ncbi:MAG: hypothetical protein J0J04_08090 [Microbacterium sp.]|uniref:hypothetical protein n=1 Tax=Microbacterium sp. TaxID=51671 RepID=UPI001ACC5162|nr:hypothetical protein [Microbacterium sp.]MBN9214760.1 hypothetical protein [Microbacterium sp.]
MSTFDESLHPRGQVGNRGQFAEKRNAAPAGQLMDDIMTPETLTGNWTSDDIAGAEGVTETTLDEFAAGDVVDATQLKAGDTLLWRSMTDEGERYFTETVTFVQQGIDDKYRRVVDVETKRRPGGEQSIRFRATQSVGIVAEPESPVEYPPLRDGHTPEQLQVVVESSDAYGSTVMLQKVGGDRMLDRFRVPAKLAPGAIPLLEAGRDVQQKVAHRFIPLAGLSYDDYLAREPIGHGGRAWND